MDRVRLFLSPSSMPIQQHVAMRMYEGTVKCPTCHITPMQASGRGAATRPASTRVPA